MITSDLMWSAVGFLLTIMVLSYLIGDNAFFRLAVHIFIGLTAGYLAVLLIRHVLLPGLIQPLLEEPGQSQLRLILPVVLILLLALGQAPRLSWLGRIPLAYLAGVTAALVIGGAVFGTLIPQTRGVINAFDPARWTSVSGQTWPSIMNAVVILIGVVGTLSYFHFGQKLKPGSRQDMGERPFILESLSKVGQVFIGISLGALFAGVFSTALLALINRLIFMAQFVMSLLEGS